MRTPSPVRRGIPSPPSPPRSCPYPLALSPLLSLFRSSPLYLLAPPFLPISLSLSPDFVLSLSHTVRPVRRPRSARIPTVVGFSPYDCLPACPPVLPARAMPCSECLTPTLHVRTTERPPRSLLQRCTRSTSLLFCLPSLSLSLSALPPPPPVYLSSSPSFSTVPLRGTARVGGVHPLPRTFRISLILSSLPSPSAS